MTGQPTISITHDRAARRFYADVTGGRAVAAYDVDDGTMLLTHTTVPEAAEGQGVGSALAREALGHARAEGMKVEAHCPFMASYLARHPEYKDLR